ncbi:MAG: GntR family transcriptional regulator, partial [Sphingorhabdus sp.]
LVGASPQYMRIQRDIRQRIESHQLQPRDALPPERELADEYGVSRVTIRKAIDGLVQEGHLSRRQGAGTFVVGRVEKHFSRLTSFSDDMGARGMRASSRWLSKSAGSVTPNEAITMGLSPGTQVYRFARIREADGSSMALEYSTILGSALPGIETVGDSLYAALETTGSRPFRALQRLRAVLFDKEQAKLLDIEAGAPGLFIERRGFLRDGTPVELTQSWYRGDAYDFIAELTAGQS